VSEILIPVAFWTILLFSIGAFVWQIRRMRHGTLSRVRTVSGFFLIATAPIVLYVMAFLLAVIIEEISGMPIVAEGYARSLLFVVTATIAWVLLLTAAFAVLVMFVSRKRS
jgi:hypothetical protein